MVCEKVAVPGEKIDLKLTCIVFGVSRSGYYRFNDKRPRKREIENGELSNEIQKIHTESRETYGVPRILREIRRVGKSAGHGRVYRLMKLLGISGKNKKKFKIKTTDSNHNLPIAERVFKTEEIETHPVKPNSVWVGDISYIATSEGFVYLAMYLDLFTRKIVGFSMAEHMRTELLIDALEMATGRQEVRDGNVVAHSDRGSQYASIEYREKLSSLGFIPSMSRKGNCYDNAFAETFFATLKNDLVYRTKFKTRQEAMSSIFEYIEVFYNRKRMHSSLGYLSPVEYERVQLAA